MLKNLTMVLFVAAILGISLAEGQTDSQCNALHWDSRRSDELSWKQSVSRRTRLSSSERARLSSSISNQLKDTDLSAMELRKIASESRIKYVELNADNQPEIIVQPASGALCSPTGNCPFWLFRRVKDGYELLLDAEAQTFTIQPTTSHGFRDVVLTRHGSAFESDGQEFRFNGKRYQLFRTFAVQWFSEPDEGERQPLKTPKLTDCRIQE
jgi:hypothetical protein